MNFFENFCFLPPTGPDLRNFEKNTKFHFFAYKPTIQKNFLHAEISEGQKTKNDRFVKKKPTIQKKNDHSKKKRQI